MVKLTEEDKLKQLFKCSRCKDKNWLKQCECGYCDKIIIERDRRGKLRKYVIGHQLIKKQSKNYKNGRIKRRDYWYIYLPDYFSSTKQGYVCEHVYFFQEYHKCCMLPWGDVHHIIPIKDGGSNMYWNLQGMIHGKHIKFHHVKDTSNRKCYGCKSNKTWIDKNGHYQWHKYKSVWLCNKCNMKKYHKKILLKKLNE